VGVDVGVIVGVGVDVRVNVGVKVGVSVALDVVVDVGAGVVVVECPDSQAPIRKDREKIKYHRKEALMILY